MNDPILKAYAYDFFKLVQLLETLTRTEVSSRNIDPGAARVRFSCSDSFGFPPSDLASLQVSAGKEDSGEIYRAIVNFFGLFGSNSPLPTYITEMIGAFEGERDPLKDFLEIFNDRLTTFYFESWKKTHPALNQTGRSDAGLEQWLWSLVGVDPEGVEALSDRDVRQAALNKVSLFSQHPRTAIGFEGFLRPALGPLPVRVEQFVGRKFRTPKKYQCRLSSQAPVTRLGVNNTLGERVPDRTNFLRIHVGPVDLATYLQLMPGELKVKRMVHLIRAYLPIHMDFEILLLLLTDQAPAVQLTSAGRRRLGWDSFLGPAGGERRATKRIREARRTKHAQANDTGRVLQRGTS